MEKHGQESGWKLKHKLSKAPILENILRNPKEFVAGYRDKNSSRENDQGLQNDEPLAEDKAISK